MPFWVTPRCGLELLHGRGGGRPEEGGSRAQLSRRGVTERDQIRVELGHVGAGRPGRQGPIGGCRAVQQHHRAVVHPVEHLTLGDHLAERGQLGVGPAGLVDHRVRRAVRLPPDRSGSHSRRPWPRAPAVCTFAVFAGGGPVPQRSLASSPDMTTTPPAADERQPGRPLRPAPSLPLTGPALQLAVLIAVHVCAGLEPRNAPNTRLWGGRRIRRVSTWCPQRSEVRDAVLPRCASLSTGRVSPPCRDRRRRADRPLAGTCRSPAKATDGRHLRLAGVHRRLQLRRARPDAGLVHFAARKRRVGEVRHPVGADALGPVQPRLLLGGRELLAGGVPRRRQSPCRPAGPLGTQPSSGQFRWSCTRSLRSGSAPGRGSSGRRGCVCTGSRPQLRRASTPPTELILRRSGGRGRLRAGGRDRRSARAAGDGDSQGHSAATAHRCDGRMIPPCDTTRPSGVVSEELSPATVLVRWVMPPVKHSVVLPARMWFSIRRRYAPAA